ncbi:MAG: LptF/LptG family permease, partial [Variovorax sp.]
VASSTGQLMKAKYRGYLNSAGNTGAWLKEKRDNKSYAVNVASINRDGTLTRPSIFEFDANGFVSSQITANSATIDGDVWVLNTVEQQIYETKRTADTGRVVINNLPELRWPTALTAEMVSVALLKPDRMGTIDLFEYIRHLDANGQTAQRYEIEFWRKVFYPLSCLVMVVLALPFAYLHFRQAGITTYVFCGVLIGISFFMLNNVFGYLGNLSNWRPWITAAAPGLIYSLMSLGAFTWLVLRR